MKKIMSALLFLLCFVNAFSQPQPSDSQIYLEQNLAITNITARVISKTEYVVEIKLKDYSGLNALPAGFGSEEKIYADDGKDYDLVRGDAVFTTKQKYVFQTEDRSSLERNVVLHDPNFQHKTLLENDPELMNRATTMCKFIKVGCPPVNGGNCPACRWWGWSCWEMLPCGTGVEW